MSIFWGGPPTNQPGIKVHSLVARVCLTTSGPTTDSLLKLPTRLSLETKVSTQQSMFLKRSCSTVASRKVLPMEGKSQNGKQSIVATTVQRGKPGSHFELMCVYYIDASFCWFGFLFLCAEFCFVFVCITVTNDSYFQRKRVTNMWTHIEGIFATLLRCRQQARFRLCLALTALILGKQSWNIIKDF